MHRLKSNKLIDGLQLLAKLSQQLQMHSERPGFAGLPYPENGYEIMRAHIADMRDEALEIDLDVTAANLDKALVVLDRGSGSGIHLPPHDARNFLRHMEMAQTALRDQFSNRTTLVLPVFRAKLFEPDEPLFGAEVDAKFRTRGRREISEAGKCLALERPTACVFHLMRTVELGLEAVRISLGLPRPAKGQHKAWGAALNSIRQELQGRDNLTYVRQWASLSDKKFFEEVYMMLNAIKDGCRDDTMHIESNYDLDGPQGAEHLFGLTKGFMQKLASRLDEDGKPPA